MLFLKRVLSVVIMLGLMALLVSWSGCAQSQGGSQNQAAAPASAGANPAATPAQSTPSSSQQAQNAPTASASQQGGSAPAAQSNTPAPSTPVVNSAPPAQTGNQYLASNCSVIGADDVKPILGADRCEEKLVKQTDSRCMKDFIAYKGIIPSYTVALTDIKVSADPTYKAGTITQELGTLCNGKPTLGLGDYVSCNFFGQITFGVGGYMIFLACPQCPIDKTTEIAGIVAKRVKADASATSSGGSAAEAPPAPAQAPAPDPAKDCSIISIGDVNTACNTADFVQAEKVNGGICRVMFKKNGLLFVDMKVDDIGAGLELPDCLKTGTAVGTTGCVKQTAAGSAAVATKDGKYLITINDASGLCTPDELAALVKLIENR